ncbi:glycerophosphodiester phosphodiesterase [Burkholderia cepacia]|uniref:glycerophosphodiester phosphodiesterase n=1 Tax=Burkholderia cepacia TaxID=292 RepID=UPI002AB75EC3|nr:glycerophosphodiester phosphodiesterase [Burkholderia cepacia]
MKLPQIIAHQGGAAEWPPNSRIAFESVALLPVDAVELDVHRTQDGELFVLHDAALKLPTGRRAVRTLTSSEVREASLNTGGAMTLREVLNLFANVTFDVQIDVKTDCYGIDYDGLDDDVARIVAQSGIGTRIIISSFLPQTLRRFRDLMPDVRLRAGLMPLVTEQLGGAFSAIEQYAKLGVTLIDGNFRMLDTRVIEAAKAYGMTVGVGTVNGRSELIYWLQQPIDRLLTDEPSTALAFRSALHEGQ